MADNKLSWSELRRAIIVRANVKEAEATAFLNALQTQLIEALRIEKVVKINGLGTFKLQAVAPRKSVNVTTGEEITIDGYNKIAFVPEAGVKELVEKGASELGATAAALGLNEEPKEEFNPLKKLGEQAEEIVEILGELGQRPGTNSAKKEEPKEEPKEPEKPIEEPKPVDFKPVEVTPIKPLYPTEDKEEKPKKKEFHFVRDTLICVVILLMLLLAGYFFLRSQLSGWIEELVNGAPQTEVVVNDVPKEVEQPKEEKIPEIAKEPEKPQEPEVTKEPEKPIENIRVYKEWLLTEQITQGSRLTWIAKKHYGSKIYWVYLYDANKDRIMNPGRIAVGTPIRVPKLNAAQRDTTSAEFLQLQQEAQQAIKK